MIELVFYWVVFSVVYFGVLQVGLKLTELEMKQETPVTKQEGSRWITRKTN